MNISQIMRSLIGEVQTTDAKALELKVGQVVKGMILQLLAEQEALVNIGGVHVKAKLETPLKQGQVTMLQVQPESANGQIILKPLSSSGVQISDESMPDLLKTLGMKDHAVNRQLVAQLHQDGISLTKNNTKMFTPIIQSMPQGVSSEEWIQSAIIAFKKGLPVTPSVVSSLHQVLFGKEMHAMMQQVDDEISAFLKSSTPPSSSTERQLTQLQSLLKQLQSDADTQMAKPVQNAVLSELAAKEALSKDMLASRPTLDGQQRVIDPKSTGNNPQMQNTGNPSLLQETQLGKETRVPTQPLAGQVHTSDDIEPMLAQGRAFSGVNGSDASTANKQNYSVGDHGQNKSQSQTDAEVGNRKAVPQERNETNWIPKLLRNVGIENEQRIFQLLNGSGNKALSDNDFPLPMSVLSSMHGADESSTLHSSDTLKSMLLQLSSNQELPSALKETIQQAIQQVTGQQLLLSADRSAMFSHITLFIPIFNQAGNQTAAVHIQSRKGKKGEIDSSNCRLLFDLRMNELGDTLVDVQVINKIVGLTVHNDHPLISQLFNLYRDEIAEGIQSAGYQFISLKHVPFPQKQSNETSADGQSVRNSLLQPYQEKPYKGMDMRI